MTVDGVADWARRLSAMCQIPQVRKQTCRQHQSVALGFAYTSEDISGCKTAPIPGGGGGVHDFGASLGNCLGRTGNENRQTFGS